MTWLGRKLNGLCAQVRWNLWRFNIRKIWTDVEEIVVDRPIFILGTQGGGLTLLSRILQRNSQVVNVWGDSRHWAGSDELHVVLASRLPTSLRLRGHPALQNEGVGESWTYATDELLPHFRKTAADADGKIQACLLTIIRELLLLYASQGEGYRFLDKSQSYTVKVSFLEALLDGCNPHYLLFARNPYALCRRAAMKSVSGLNRGHLELVELAAQHWENSYRCALDDGEGLDRFSIHRFEDLLIEPEYRVKEICNCLGLEYEGDMLPQPDDHRPWGSSQDRKWYPLQPDVNEKYLDDLNHEEIEIVRSRCGTIAERFGYTPEGP